MITSSDIKNKKFEKAAFGYKVDEVESFLNEVIDLVSELESKNMENEKKLVVLANKIEEYRSEEDSLRQALLGAQKLGDSILKEAKNRAEIIMRDATIKSENIVKNVKDEAKREEVILNKMKREVDAFRTKMLTMYSSQVDMIKSLPELEREAYKQEAEEKNNVNEENKVDEKTDIENNEIKADEQVVDESETINDSQNQVNEVSEPETDESVVEEPTVEIEAEQIEGFKIDGGFKFNNPEEPEKHESKFGPLKFGDAYDLDD